MGVSKISLQVISCPTLADHPLCGLLPPLGGRGLSGSAKAVSAHIPMNMKNPVFLINLFFPRKKGCRAGGQYPQKNKLQRESSGNDNRERGRSMAGDSLRSVKLWHVRVTRAKRCNYCSKLKFPKPLYSTDN